MTLGLKNLIRALLGFSCVMGTAFGGEIDTKKFMADLTKGLPRVIDTHMHLLGMQTEKTGCYLHPDALNPWKPHNYIKSKMLLKACGVTDLSKADEQAWGRLSQQISSFPGVPYVGLVFAFAATHNKADGKINLGKTSFHVPNSAVLKFAATNKRVIPVGSIHPYQKKSDLENEFKLLAANNVKFLKMLPNSMHFNPSDEICDTYFAKAAEFGMTVITHVGHEHSVSYAGINNDMGNPLLYKRWLEKYPKLKIIFAHVGSEGKSLVDGKKVENFDLVLSLLKDEKYRGRTFADISAFSSSPLRIPALKRLLGEKEVHAQLLFGSDYPLPAIEIMAKLSLWNMKMKGLLDKNTKNALGVLLREHPMAYNFAAMRSVSMDGAKFPDAVFGENFRTIAPEVAKLVQDMEPNI